MSPKEIPHEHQEIIHDERNRVDYKLTVWERTKDAGTWQYMVFKPGFRGETITVGKGSGFAGFENALATARECLNADLAANQIYWSLSTRDMVIEHNPPGEELDERLAAMPVPPWKWYGDCANHRLFIYALDDDQWTFGMVPDYGKDPAELRTDLTFTGPNKAKVAAIDAVRVTCGDCQVDCTFDGYITSFQMVEGEAKITAITCRACDMQARIDLYKDTGRIDNKLQIEAVLSTHRFENKPEDEWPAEIETFQAIIAACSRVQEAVTRFEEAVWFGGLQEWVHNCKWRGASAEFGDGVKFLSYTMCARSRVTLQHPEGFFIDVITSEDGDRRVMGINGIGCTEQQGIVLLDHACEAWSKGEIDIKADNEVGIL